MGLFCSTEVRTLRPASHTHGRRTENVSKHAEFAVHTSCDVLDRQVWSAALMAATGGRGRGGGGGGDAGVHVPKSATLQLDILQRCRSPDIPPIITSLHGPRIAPGRMQTHQRLAALCVLQVVRVTHHLSLN